MCEGSFKGLTSLGEVLLSLQSIDFQNQCSCYPRWLLLVKMLNKGTWDSVRIENSSICERVLCPGKRSLFIFQPLCFAMLECTLWILNMWGTFCACLKKHRMCGWKARGGTIGVLHIITRGTWLAFNGLRDPCWLGLNSFPIHARTSNHYYSTTPSTAFCMLCLEKVWHHDIFRALPWNILVGTW